jgi:hypothetical protein
MNTAANWCDPTPNVAFSIAVPLLTVTGVPMLVLPSRNCTVPTAAAGVIVAVIVIGVFSTTGEVGAVASVVPVVVAPEITKVTAGEVDAL